MHVAPVSCPERRPRRRAEQTVPRRWAYCLRDYREARCRRCARPGGRCLGWPRNQPHTGVVDDGKHVLDGCGRALHPRWSRPSQLAMAPVARRHVGARHAHYGHLTAALAPPTGINVGGRSARLHSDSSSSCSIDCSSRTIECVPPLPTSISPVCCAISSCVFERRRCQRSAFGVIAGWTDWWIFASQR